MLLLLFTLLISTLNIASSQQDPGEPLIITPLLKAGKYLEAQEKCKVPGLVSGYNSSGYSAFVQMDELTETNLHFWFIPREDTDNWKEYPLVFWLQGGFGLTSLRAGFGENLLSYGVYPDGSMRKTDQGLSRYVNILFVDNANVGFAHTKNSNFAMSTYENIAVENYAFLEQFFLLFPDLPRKVYLGGLSAGGVKVFPLGKLILEKNNNISLEGIIVGDSPTILQWDLTDIGPYFNAYGLMTKTKAQNLSELADAMDACDNAYRYDLKDRVFNYDFLTVVNRQIGFPSGGIVDVRKTFSYADRWTSFMEEPEIRFKMHVGRLKLIVENPQLHARLEKDVVKSQNANLEIILNQNVPFLRFNGQFDGIQPYQGTIRTLRNLNWFGLKCFHTNQWKRKMVYIGGELFGYSRKCRQIWELFVLKAHHVVYLSVPANLWIYVDKFIRESK